MPGITGQLAPERGDATYRGFSARLDFNQRSAISGAPEGEQAFVWLPKSLRAPVEEDGSFVFDVPAKPLARGPFYLTIISPNGTYVHHDEVQFRSRQEKIKLKITPAEQAAVTVHPDWPKGRRRRLPGRVIDADGKGVAWLPVIVWVREDGDDEGTFTAVDHALTDGTGYFSVARPFGEFVEAYGQIGGGEEPPKVPVVLEKGRFPDQLLFVLDRDAAPLVPGEKGGVPRGASAEDLASSPGTYAEDIGGGRCVDFTIPDRTVEEFRFYHVVRTSDPEIYGTTDTTGGKNGSPELVSMYNAATAPPKSGGRDHSANLQSTGPSGEMLFGGDFDMRRVSNNLRDPKGVNPQLMWESIQQDKQAKLGQIMAIKSGAQPGRSEITLDNPVDWDSTPTFYQATTIAHGHILTFKQVWKADGYSMGDLLYSLPLAPCQKKRIAVVDWHRRESTERTEEIVAEDRIDASLSRERSISEAVNMTVSEMLHGKSIAGALGRSMTAGAAGTFKMFSGAAGFSQGLGIGASWAKQEGLRELAGETMQSLRDVVLQSASSLRSQRVSVIETTTQEEGVRVETEVVANHNHCHAMTMEYFEVLKHYRVEHSLDQAQECLFIPLAISRFDLLKALRWRDPLSDLLRKPKLAKGFDALERIHDNWANSDLPVAAYADETVSYIDGEITINIVIGKPADDGETDPEKKRKNLFNFIKGMVSGGVSVLLDELKDAGIDVLKNFFNNTVKRHLGERMINSLAVELIDMNGNAHDARLMPDPIGDFRLGVNYRVGFRHAGGSSGLSRRNIARVRISADKNLLLDGTAMIKKARFNYRTRHLKGRLVVNRRVNDDISKSDDVEVWTLPLTEEELLNPRQMDRDAGYRLLNHLNEHIEYYHKALWLGMDPSRRFMLLDGFLAPGGGGRSLASVLENRIVAIVGNSLVMPVTPGINLDPDFRWGEKEGSTLLSLYEQRGAMDPIGVALPQSGVYAEAVMGKCNSCEEIDDTRFWRWEESPCPDEPTEILPVSTESRRAEPADMAPTPLATPIINMQQAPAAPDPQGLSGAFDLLSSLGAFRDVTGLTQNQLNAIKALEKTQDSAVAMAEMAKELQLQNMLNRQADRNLKRINDAESKGQISPEQAKDLRHQALKTAIGGKGGADGIADVDNVDRLIDRAGQNGAVVGVTTPSGERVDIDAKPSAGMEDEPSTWQIVVPAKNSSDHRSFYPSIPAIGGEIRLDASLQDPPIGATGPQDVRWKWEALDQRAVNLLTPDKSSTTVQGVTPGPTRVRVTATWTEGDKAKSQSEIVSLCVPQFFVIDADSTFSDALARYNVAGHEVAVIDRAREVADLLLRTVNVRLIWRTGGRTDEIPPHLVSVGGLDWINVGHVKITDRDPDHLQSIAGNGTLGDTNPDYVSGHDDLLTVHVGELYKSFVPNHSPINVTEQVMKALIDHLAANAADVTATNLLVDIIGRLAGSTLAHEILHAVIGIQPGMVDQNHISRRVLNDLLNTGSSREFHEKTGIKVQDLSKLPSGGYVDYGIHAIEGPKHSPTKGADRTKEGNMGSQDFIDEILPVPPAFK